MKLIPYKYQEELSDQALDILRANMLVYLAMEERTGKTLTALLVAEKAKLTSVLIVTKKKALEGWKGTLADFPHTKDYTLTNYHQVKKLKADYDLVILDEAHNYISSFPKKSAMWKDVYKVTRGKPIIYLSATPHAQGPQLLYHQFALSSWSPWKEYNTSYKWFSVFGMPNTIWINARQVEQYNKVRSHDVLSPIKHLFITKTRQELDFEQEPEDKLHYVELKDKTKTLYNELQDKRIIELNKTKLIADTSMKLRTSLHMLEGGVAKIDDKYLVLSNTEKLDYIKQHWGDTKDLVIMYQYIAEGKKLAAHFKHALILQGTSFAEGIDLSDKAHLIIYSQDFSTARHTQRRARQANKNREEAITVHYLLVKDGISDQVYNTVSINKTNFIDLTYQKIAL